jgi:hypothetical protein
MVKLEKSLGSDVEIKEKKRLGSPPKPEAQMAPFKTPH